MASDRIVTAFNRLLVENWADMDLHEPFPAIWYAFLTEFLHKIRSFVQNSNILNFGMLRTSSNELFDSYMLRPFFRNGHRLQILSFLKKHTGIEIDPSPCGVKFSEADFSEKSTFLLCITWMWPCMYGIFWRSPQMITIEFCQNGVWVDLGWDIASRKNRTHAATRVNRKFSNYAKHNFECTFWRGSTLATTRS